MDKSKETNVKDRKVINLNLFDLPIKKLEKEIKTKLLFNRQAPSMKQV